MRLDRRGEERAGASGIPSRRHETVRYAVALSAFALLAHYVWENLHCPLFVHRPGVTPMWAAMIWASLGDVLLTWMAQLTLAVATRRWIWPRGARLPAWLLLLALAAGMAIAIEAYALATGRWSYAATNPRLPGFGVSVLPLAQLMVLFPLSFLAAARIASGQTLPSRRAAGAGRP
jgi:hypothetical protein